MELKCQSETDCSERGKTSPNSVLPRNNTNTPTPEPTSTSCLCCSLIAEITLVISGTFLNNIFTCKKICHGWTPSNRPNWSLELFASLSLLWMNLTNHAGRLSNAKTSASPSACETLDCALTSSLSSLALRSSRSFISVFDYILCLSTPPPTPARIRSTLL